MSMAKLPLLHRLPLQLDGAGQLRLPLLSPCSAATSKATMRGMLIAAKDVHSRWRSKRSAVLHVHLEIDRSK